MTNLDALLTGDADTVAMKPCVVGAHVLGLPEPYATAVRTMLNNHDLSADVVSFRLKSAGLKGSNRTILLHRRALCGCPAEVRA